MKFQKKLYQIHFKTIRIAKNIVSILQMVDKKRKWINNEVYCF